MKILITNDDGIEAPGLAALARAASAFGDVIVVAPDQAHSGCGHRVTSEATISLTALGPQRWSISGTPADCVRLGLWEFARNADWVFSGINNGGNLGVDVFMSGTVAAVREAALHHKPGIAISHYRRSGAAIDWNRAVEFAQSAIHRVLQQGVEPGEFWNVNLPDLTGMPHLPQLVECPLSPHHLPMRFDQDSGGWRYRGDYHSRPRNTGDDVDTCFGGHIALTRVRVW